MRYALESAKEFERLEIQSTYPKYDYRRELALAGVQPRAGQSVLDAGCGSGVVTRHLAGSCPEARVTGVDFSHDRVAHATEAARALKNIAFQQADLTKLSFADASFDTIVCRYVMQHILPADQPKVLAGFMRCLKPGGTLCLIDFDGSFYNIFPRPPALDAALNLIERDCPVDLRIGRKLPALLASGGFNELTWAIDTVECKGESMVQEKLMLPSRFENSAPVIERLLGGKAQAKSFAEEYMRALDAPGVVLFYNKFVATGRKPAVLRRVK